MKEKKSRLLPKVAGISGFLLGVLVPIFTFFYFDWFIQWLETNFSPDGNLNVFTRFFIGAAFGLVSLSVITYSLLVLTNNRKRMFTFLVEKIFSFAGIFIDTEKMKDFFYPGDEPVVMNKWILFFGSFLSVLLHGWVLYFGIPKYEGLLENVSALLVFTAIILLILGLPGIRRKSWRAGDKKIIGLTVSVITVMLILYLGEELSWGQHFFQWQATGIFETYNYQQETNLHNFVNPVLALFYPLVGLTSFLALFLMWVFPSAKAGVVQRIVFPSPAFFIVFLLLAGSGFYGPSELFEALLSLGIFLYGIRFFVLTRQKVISENDL